MRLPGSLLSRLSEDRRRALRRASRRPFWGNLRRLQPFSARFGFERGTPIDRYYTDLFFDAQRDRVRGIVAEVAEASLALRFGSGLDAVHVIDVEASNPQATIVADLGDEQALPSAAFDCVILTQTLQYIPDPGRALEGIARSLRPGGTLLVAAPALTPHDAKEAASSDYWRFWPAGLELLARRAMPDATVQVQAYGNVLAAVAFLHGLSAEELRPAELADRDDRYPVVVCLRADLPMHGPVAHYPPQG